MSIAHQQLTFCLTDSTFPSKAYVFTFSKIIKDHVDGLTNFMAYTVKGVQWVIHFVSPTL